MPLTFRVFNFTLNSTSQHYKSAYGCSPEGMLMAAYGDSWRAHRSAEAVRVLGRRYLELGLMHRLSFTHGGPISAVGAPAAATAGRRPAVTAVPRCACLLTCAMRVGAAWPLWYAGCGWRLWGVGKSKRMENPYQGDTVRSCTEKCCHLHPYLYPGPSSAARPAGLAGVRGQLGRFPE